MLSDKKIIKYLALADVASEQSSFKRQRLGAVMVYHGKPLASAANSSKTHPVQHTYNKLRFDVDCNHNGSVHSEIACLLKTKYLDIEWNKAALFVSRKTADKQSAMARPCPACMKALKDRGITDIYYTTDTGWCYEKISENA